MRNNIDLLLVNKILQSIPEKINPVDYLMEILNLSSDSVYRRINCKKSFTYHEIVKLSSTLNFSVDEIIHLENNLSDGLMQSSNTDIEASIYLMLKHYIALSEGFSRAKTGEIIMAVNRLPTMFTCGHEDLFRFTSYRWMHLMRELPLDHPFDNFRLPQNITSPSKVLFEYSKIVKNAVFIFDENLYLNMIKDIQYFYKRKLISEDDLLSLKESLISIIDWGKGIMLNDQLDSSNSFYLSTLNLNSNTIYFRYDDIEETDIWSFSPNPIYIKDPVSCSVHRKWLHSLRRYSALISGANENIFYDFMNKQYDYVRNIDKIFL